MFGIETEKLCSGLFSDVMDKLGYRSQIVTNMQRNKSKISFIGRARTVLIETLETQDENIRKGLSFLGNVGKEEVLIVKGSDKFAYFGELMTKLSTRMGIEGIIIDGLTRDSNYTHGKGIKLPILARGYSPVDIKGRGRVQETDVTISIDGIEIEPGTLIYADNEAVCIIPKNIENEVIEKVKIKIKEEEKITSYIESGMSVQELLDHVTEF